MGFTITRVLSFASTIVVSSVMFGTWLELSKARRDMSGPGYTELEQALRPHGWFMAPAIVLSVVTAVALVVLLRRPRDAAFWLSAVAAACLVTAFVVTIVVQLPINTAIEDWSIRHPPADWRHQRDRWEDWHTLRAWASVAALGCLIAAAVRRPARNA
jgi:hypothetical protein